MSTLRLRLDELDLKVSVRTEHHDQVIFLECVSLKGLYMVYLWRTMGKKVFRITKFSDCQGACPRMVRVSSNSVFSCLLPYLFPYGALFG